MYETLLDSIIANKRQYGERPQPPRPANELARLRIQAQRDLSFDIPNEYSEFLSIANGLVWNGLCILQVTAA
jgi:hypothetical protein